MPIFILDAKEGQCRFPLWGEDATIGDVCGAKTEPGASYCGACHRRTHEPAPRPPLAPRVERAGPRQDREPDLVEAFI